MSNSSQWAWDFKRPKDRSKAQANGNPDVIHDTSGSPPQSPSVDSGINVSDTSSDRVESVSKRYVRWFFWSAAFVLTATISATLGATVALLTPLSPFIIPHNPIFGSKGNLWRQGFPYDLARPVNILVMGIDRVPDVPKSSPDVFAGRSDTMLLVRLDSREKSVKMLSIPRDTQVEIPGVGIAKINDANVEGGPALAARVTSHTLNDVPIDRYVRVTTDAFRELVDLVGGVEVFVPYQMKYKDVTQNLNIDLEQGWQTLNGDQAEQFARFRKDQYGDIGRVQRQQILLKALRQRLVSPTVLPRLPQVIRVMQQYVDTNLSIEEMLALVGFGLDLQPDDFKMVLLPGRFSSPKEYKASYWLMDSAGKDRVMQEYFQQNPDWSSSDVRRSPDRLRIAIQNATDDPELAHRVAKYLAEKDFHNVYIVRDWPDRLQQTQIIVQQGDLKAATAVKRVLGIGKVEASSVGDLESDLTIRVGEDWLEQDF
ncbi:MAG TPA: LytR family transcriptional regulator [Cyanobacteria bacterium UBA8803]|nr:LytR family transcriptional regulator [Cyanobacteria bacterium UBA9273]HBL57640.1 LytR family transcriptional regulator [Cyanobacteria bacterium UBA8803]